MYFYHFFRLFGKNYRHCVLALIICRHTIGPDVTLSHYKVKALIFWHLTDGSNDFYVINPWFKNAFRFNQGVFCSASTSTVHFNSNTQNKNWNAEILSSMTEITVCVSVWKWVEKWGLTVILLVTQHFLWLERKQNMAAVHVTLDRLMESPQTDIRR